MPVPFGYTKKARLWGLLKTQADGFTVNDLMWKCDLSSHQIVMKYIRDAAANNWIEVIDTIPYPHYRWTKNESGEVWDDAKGRLLKLYA